MRKVLLLAVALVVVLGAQYLTWHQHSAVTVTSETIAGNPVDHYTTAPPGNSRGVVIVAHGFASNKEFMSPWGYYLAQSGFDAYVLDQPGHGDSNRPLPAWQGVGNDVLGQNLRALIDELVKQGRAEPGRIALVGHSMGGAAVTSAALADSRVKATVAISSAFAGEVPGDKPANLLSLAASGDPTSTVRSVTALATQTAGGHGELGKQYGSFLDGTARESALIPGRNHITIVFDPNVMQQTAGWIGAALGVEVRPAAARSWLWVCVALAGALGAVLVIGAMLAPADRPRDNRLKPVGFLTGVVTLAVAAFSAVLAAAYIRFPWPRVAVTDYLLPYFLVMALVLLLLRWLWPRDFSFPLGPGFEVSLGDGVRAIGVFIGYVGAVGTIIQMNLNHYIPGSTRIVPMLVIAVCLWLYFVQEEGLKRAISSGLSPWVGALAGLIGKLIVALTWLGASALPNPQRFLPLALPVVVVFLVVLEFMSAVLARWRYSAVAVATFMSLVLAWSLAVSFPLI